MGLTDRAKAIGARIDALRARHAALDAQIGELHGRPLPDTVTLRSLKSRKLRLRDEIRKLEGVVRTVARGTRPNQAAT